MVVTTHGGAGAAKSMLLDVLYSKEGRVWMKLTEREKDVLGLLDMGQSAKEMAESLFISSRTVNFHVANIYEKLEVKNRMQALNKARQLGLMEGSE